MALSKTRSINAIVNLVLSSRADAAHRYSLLAPDDRSTGRRYNRQRAGRQLGKREENVAAVTEAWKAIKGRAATGWCSQVFQDTLLQRLTVCNKRFSANDEWAECKPPMT